MNDPRILGPIPTPPAQRWREVRLVYLPRTVFVVGVVVAAWLWSSWVAPATMIAEADVTQVDVRSAQAGVVAALTTDLLKPVHRGDVLARIAPVNPQLLDATLAVIRADVAMLSATMSGATDRIRVAQTFERMQLDWLKGRADLAALRGKLQLAESDLARMEPLHAKGLISDQDYEQLKVNRDALVSQVAEQAQLTSRYETVLHNSTTPESQAAALSSDSSVAAAIKVQEAKLKLAEEQLTPQPLLAPMDGVVSAVLRHPGEEVSAGDVVLRVTAGKAERLVGFLRQPLTVEPKPGMTAEIRTRGAHRVVATTKITDVGVAFEPIMASVQAAMHLPTNPPPEQALRVQFALPAGLTLRPGENVDVTLR